jgi:hypothetical protein
MWRFGRWPPTIRPIPHAITIASAWYLNTRELDASGGGAKRYIIRVVMRHPGVAHALRHAEPAEVLHCARRYVIALHARQLVAMALFGHNDIDAAPRQIHRERGADRAAADHQHTCSETSH